MEKDSLLLKFLGKSPQLRIIDFLLDNKLLDFSKKEIIELEKLLISVVAGKIEERKLMVLK